MKQSHSALLTLSACVLAAPLLAQPSIGGGTCSTSTVTGNYAVSITGRGVSAVTGSGSGGASTSENITMVFQAVGSAAFDGLSKATFTLVADTNQAAGTAMTWSGTYTVQSNCAATVTITSGGTATLNLLLYNNGASFTLTGSDSSYAYAGSANTQAVGCSTSTLAGQYAVTVGSGYLGMGAATAGGAAGATGIAVFDGQGNVTFNGAFSANSLLGGVTGSISGTLTGTYSMGANCVGTGTITSVLIGNEQLNFSVYGGNSTLSQNMFVSVASTPVGNAFIGSAMWIGPLEATGAEQTSSLDARKGGF